MYLSEEGPHKVPEGPDQSDNGWSGGRGSGEEGTGGETIELVGGEGGREGGREDIESDP